MRQRSSKAVALGTLRQESAQGSGPVIIGKVEMDSPSSGNGAVVSKESRNRLRRLTRHSGVFQWLAFKSYQLSGGRRWLLLAILMVVAGITSALLDNVTTMLLMAHITVQIALALGMNPLAQLMPEVMASNVFGISTLIGTPTNILISSYARISFTGFLFNLTPGILLAMGGLIVYAEWLSML